jgi:hypothetical protein
MIAYDLKADFEGLLFNTTAFYCLIKRITTSTNATNKSVRQLTAR